MRLLFFAVLFFLAGCGEESVNEVRPGQNELPYSSSLEIGPLDSVSSSSEIAVESSSSEDALSCSAEIFSSSSLLQSSSSVEIESLSNGTLYVVSSSSYAIDSVLWYECDTNVVVKKYVGGTSEVLPAGRFWLFKDVPLSTKERDLLKKDGIIQYEVGRYQEKNVILFKSDMDVRKVYLDSMLFLFYNAIPVNDTTCLYWENDPDKFTSDTLPLILSCWPDVDVADCINVVESCGGMNIEYDSGDDVLFKMVRDSVHCVQTSEAAYAFSACLWIEDVLNR